MSLRVEFRLENDHINSLGQEFTLTLFLTADSSQCGVLVRVTHCHELKILQTTRVENHQQLRVNMPVNVYQRLVSWLVWPRSLFGRTFARL